MGRVRFDERDAELLFSFPKPPTDLPTLVRYFTFIQRTAPPTYAELSGCLTKALGVGILRREAGKFVVDADWYDRIHQFDAASANEIDSMLQFEERFVGVGFDVVIDASFSLSREDYARACENFSPRAR